MEESEEEIPSLIQNLIQKSKETHDEVKEIEAENQK